VHASLFDVHYNIISYFKTR